MSLPEHRLRYAARVENTLYRRPLPPDTIAFSSPEGRALFAEALASGGLDGYFPLAEQFHTQADPAFCGLGSLVVALNALAIDPGRLWKGPWRWFAEDLLDCCVPLSHVREHGLSLDQLACLARCNGAEVEVERGELDAFHSALGRCARAERVLVTAYDRTALGQTGGGHFSPIGGYHAARQLVLVLDVARFKYPPHWLPAEKLWRATQGIDPTTGLPRGWLQLRARSHGLALGYSLRCDGESWEVLSERMHAAAQLDPLADLGALARGFGPLVSHVESRQPAAEAHRVALESARAALRAHPAFAQVEHAVGVERAEAVLLLMLTMEGVLGPTQREQLRGGASGPLADELSNLRAQLAAIAFARPGC